MGWLLTSDDRPQITLRVADAKERGIGGGDLVFPGDVLGVIEEFTAGDGTYTYDGKVVACRLGIVEIDSINRRVMVTLVGRVPTLPKKGDIVLGVVTGIRRDLAEVNIHQIEGGASFSTPFEAILPVSKISTHFIRHVAEAVKLGDMIRAKVLLDSPHLTLSIKEEGLGVIAASCPLCSSLMGYYRGKLVCDNCRLTVKGRKISPFYVRKPTYLNLTSYVEHGLKNSEGGFT
ncbi:MAG: exosome complex RNA-binding protein Csl4 [Candidatus Nezhaarchaeales archaeon]